MSTRRNGRPPDAAFARSILKRLPKGYKIAYSTGRSSHPSLLDPDGVVVRLPGGLPVRFSGSPSDHNAINRALADIRRAGIPVT